MAARSRNHFRVLQRKRYEARRFRNPYFRHETSRNWRTIIVGAAVIALLVATVGWIFRSKRFEIGQIAVVGAESLSSDEIHDRVQRQLDGRRWLFFRERNRFLFREDSLRESLASAYAFDSLSVTTACKWFGSGGCSLDIYVVEKTSQLLWRSSESLYLVDLRGTVIREITPAETEAWESSPPATDGGPEDLPAEPDPVQALRRLPVFTDLNGTPVRVSDQVLTPEEVAGIFSFQDRLRELDIAFVGTNVDRLAGKWMAVRTEAGYDILFDAVGDIDAQTRHLEILFRDTVTDPSGLEYVDLRFGDHIYFK